MFDERLDLIYGDAHGFGNLLDPRYLGDGMSESLRERTEDSLFLFPMENGFSTEAQAEVLHCEYFKFIISSLKRREEDSFRYKVLSKGSQCVLQFWQSDASYWPNLQKIALKVFSMPRSSAASERNFSTFGFIHSKLRNRLSEEKLEKLVYIKFNSESNGCENECDDDNTENLPFVVGQD